MKNLKNVWLTKRRAEEQKKFLRDLRVIKTELVM